MKLPKEITVIQGYHYGLKKTKKSKNKPYVNTTKAYNFKVTKQTHNPKLAKINHTCSVLTKLGKRYLVITKIMHVKGSVALKFASQLKPVINFHNYGMKPKWFYKYVERAVNQKHK